MLRIDAIRNPGGMRLIDIDGYLAQHAAGVKVKNAKRTKGVKVPIGKRVRQQSGCRNWSAGNK